jgi:lysozyme
VRVSENGIDFICQWEKLALEPYNDGAGYMTIGFGHRVREGEHFKRIDEDQAKDLLMSDIEDVEIKLSDCIEREISQEQFDACVSLAFNIGNHAFERSTLLQKLNHGRPFKEVSPQFDRWVFAGSKKMAGLVKRRAAERKLFETGEYDARH